MATDWRKMADDYDRRAQQSAPRGPLSEGAPRNDLSEVYSELALICRKLSSAQDSKETD